MRQISQTLASGDIGAATAAIQNRLNKFPIDLGVRMAPMPHVKREMRWQDIRDIKNINDLDSDRSNSRAPERSDSGIPDFVNDLLIQLGVVKPVSDLGYGIDPTRRTSRSGARATPAAETDINCNVRFLTRSYGNHVGKRDYKLYIPSSYKGQSMPMVVMLHGCSQNPDDFANGTRMNDLAEEHECIVVYPAQARSANSSNCWNWFKSIDQQRGDGEPSIIAGITREVAENYAIDTDRVYVAGLSSGGAMAIIMATTYPDLYAAVGVHSGLPYASAHDLPSAFAAMRGNGSGAQFQNSPDLASQSASIPIIVFHGDSDTTVNRRNGEQLMEQNVGKSALHRTKRGNRIGPDPTVDVTVEQGQVPNGHRYTCTSHHGDDGRLLAEHWVIHGAGHAWAGGSNSGSYTDGKGPDASREMLRFFYTQSKTVRQL